jgi:N-acetylneuraminic acid mutarotase
MITSETMKRRSIPLTLVLLSVFLFAESEPRFDPLPVPLSNSAVTSVKVGGDVLIFALMGMGAKNNWDAVSNSAYALNTYYGKWSEVRQIPGAVGRVGAAAVGLREEAFLLGGFAVDAQGGETPTSDVELYDARNKKWYRVPDIPVSVADSVVGAFRDRYIYLISGWSNTGAVNAVQIYDAEKQEWLKGTPIPGEPVFGHSGAIVGETIVYIDGARKNSSDGQPRFVTSQDCWIGKIDRKNPTQIQWTRLPNHPGTARFHIAAGGSERDGKIFFTGGSENLYNYKGLGLDGKPVEPSALTFAYNLRTSKWESINENTPNPTLDSRAVVVTPEKLVIVGGISKGQITAHVNELAKVMKTAKAK